MSAPKQPSPNDEGSTPPSQIEDLVSRLSLETRLHAELRKNFEDMNESSEECIKSLREEIVTLEQKQWHEREKLHDVINGLTIKCQILERKKDMCDSVEEMSLMKIKDLNALEDAVEMREEAFYSRHSKAYRKATQKYQESVAETSQSIAQEAVLAFLDNQARGPSKEAHSGDKGRSLRPNLSQNEVKKYGLNSTADFLDKHLNGIRASNKDLVREVNILEEANRQQTKIIIHLRKRLAKFNESLHDGPLLDELQSSNAQGFDIGTSLLSGIVPSLSSSLHGNVAHSSDDDFGSSTTMLTECRSDSRKAQTSRDKQHQLATPKFVRQTTGLSTAENTAAVNSSANRSTPSSRPSSRTSSSNSSHIRRGIASPKEPHALITRNWPHPEYEEVLRVCQTAKISETAQAIMQNKHDESGTRLLIRLLSGLHPDPQLAAQ